MKILVTGGSGFIGKNLILKLLKAGHSLTLLSRNPDKLSRRYGSIVTTVQWDALSGPPPAKAFDGIEAVINLMGEGVAEKRWTEAQKKKIKDTRVKGTTHLIQGALQHAPNLKTFISSSAIGIYNHTTTAKLDEDANLGSDFLSQVCIEWEAALEPIKKLNTIRTCVIRTGVVLGHDGGALKKLITPFSFGLGGKVGSGKQWMNWIHIHDLTNLFLTTLEDEQYTGVYNAVSPENATNSEFTKILGHVLRRPTFFTIPALPLKILLGDFSRELLVGQCVIPKRLEQTSFSFTYASLRSALEEAVGVKHFEHLNKRVRYERLHVVQYLNHSPEHVFDFFSEARNLEQITPSFLHFRILSQSTASIEKGSLINYKLRVRGIPIRWQTLISDWNPISSFVDVQLKGPYQLWHHTHRFTPYNEGTLIEDEVYYALPNIPIISACAKWFVKKDIHSIFEFRTSRITTLFKEKYS